MRLLLFILLAGCAFTGCASRRALVAKVAHVVVSGASFETGKPETDPATLSLAKGYLDAAAVLTWMRMPLADGFDNKDISDALNGAIPNDTTWQWQVKLLYEAEASLPNAK